MASHLMVHVYTTNAAKNKSHFMMTIVSCILANVCTINAAARKKLHFAMTIVSYLLAHVCTTNAAKNKLHLRRL